MYLLKTLVKTVTSTGIPLPNSLEAARVTLYGTPGAIKTTNKT